MKLNWKWDPNQKWLLVLIGITLLSATAFAQQQSLPTSDERGPPHEPPSFRSVENVVPTPIGGKMTSYEFWLSILVTCLGVAIIVAQTVLFLKAGGVDANDVLKSYAVTLVLMGALFAVTAGYDDKQIAPALGLFGTVVGYLLGRDYKPDSESNVSVKKPVRKRG